MSERCNKDCRAYGLAIDALEELIDIESQAALNSWLDKYNEVLCLVVSRDLPAVCHKDKNILYKLGKPEKHNHMALKHLPLQAYILAYLCKIMGRISRPAKQPAAKTATPTTAKPESAKVATESAKVSPESVAENLEEMCGKIESVTTNGITRPVRCALKKTGQFCAIHEYEELEKRRSALLSDVVKLTSPTPSPAPSPAPSPSASPMPIPAPAPEFKRQRSRGGKKLAKFGKTKPVGTPAVSDKEKEWNDILLTPTKNWGDSATE